ncbi:MAG: hypothetical protein AB7I19_01285 [Planctomycetota bacterium]
MEVVPAHAPAPIALAVAAGTVALTIWVGRGPARRLQGLTATEAAAASMLIGSAVLATTALALGACRLLTPFPFVATSVLLGAIGAWSLRPRRTILEAASPPRDPTVTRFHRWTAIAFLPLLLSALEPPQFVDACNYHLPLIDHYARRQALELASDQQLPTFGIAFHLLATIPYRLGGETAVQLLHLAFFAVAGLVLLGAGERSKQPLIGILAAALWWGQPAFASNATQALVDCVWPAFAAMAIALCMDDRAQGTRLRFGLAGLLAGTAAATKYTGAVASLPLLALAIRAVWQRRSATSVLACLLGLLAGCGPVFLWNAVATGDPLFPYLLHVFPNPFWNTDDLALQRETWRQHGAGHGLLDVLWLPWRFVVEPQHFLTAAPLSPLLWWLLLPLAVPHALRTRSGRLLMTTIILAVVVWFTQSQQVRFLSGAVLGLAWLAAASAPWWLHHRRSLLWIAYTSLAAVPLLGVVRLWRNGLPPITTDARDAKLLAKNPSLEPLWSLAASDQGARVFALFAQDLRHAACAGRSLALVGDWFGPSRFRDVWDSQRGTLLPASDALDAHRIDHLYVRVTPNHSVDLSDQIGDATSSPGGRLRVLHADRHGALFRVLPSTRTILFRPEAVPSDSVAATRPGTTWCLRFAATPIASTPPSLEFLDEDGSLVSRTEGVFPCHDDGILAATAPVRSISMRVRHAPYRSSLSSLPPDD